MRRVGLRSVPYQAWVLVLGVLLATLAARILQISSLVSVTEIRIYFWPAASGLLALLSRRLARGRYDRIRDKKTRLGLIVTIMVGWLVIYFLSGIAVTYVRNSMAGNTVMLLINVLAYGLAAVAMECVRYNLTLIAGRKNIVRFGAILTVVFFLQQANLQVIAGIDSPMSFIKIISSNILPPLIDSLVLTFLAYTCGYGSMLVYKLVDVLCGLIMPILPNYDWYMIAMSTLLRAIFIYLAVDRQRQDRSKTRKSYRQYRTQEVIFYLVATWLVLFMVGIFSYKPIAVMSNSMLPVYGRGDVVVVQKLSTGLDVKEGDIIQYQVDNKNITHRVVEIINQQGGTEKMYITKGDNSPSRDVKPVAREQIFGVVKARVPYLGLPVIWLRGVMN